MVPNGTSENDERLKEELKKLRFQNYNPRAEELKKYCEEVPSPEEALYKIIDMQNELIKQSNRRFGDPSLDVENLIPRKGNWDMKRSLASKLERLERRTQRAIAEIVRDKLRNGQNVVGVEQSAGASSDEE